MLRIANAAGFLGDQSSAPRRLVEAAEVDYLTLEYLAELTMSILARQREKDPARGYAGDFVPVLECLVSALTKQRQLKIVTNAGGVNPLACVAAAATVLVEGGLADVPLGVVSGDDLSGRIEELTRAGCELAHLDSGLPLSRLGRPVIAANAYLGAEPIARALAGGARIVITGRVADASLTVGPAMHEFGWSSDDWNRLAGASVAGHLIECGAQVTGGYSSRWSEVDLADVGYPIAELSDDGTCVITKPEGTGGVVDRRTVVEQLVYEIGDPAHYLTPDVDVDFTTVEVEPLGQNRVRVFGATGNPAPDSYKVSLAYHDGYTASGQLLVYGRDCIEKARACAEIVWSRLQQVGCELDETHVELLGPGDAVPGLHQPASNACEVVLRMAVRDERREAVEQFTRELAPLITSGPAGLAGYAEGRPRVRPVYAYWPTLVPKELITPRVEVRPASEWIEEHHAV